MIDTWISDLSYSGHIVLEHRKIAVNSQMSQWTFEMMRDAALLVLKINSICEKYGYELKDCHQANILFDGANPVWVDFGSIAKKTLKKWVAREGFLKCYYLPMKLWSKGYDGLIASIYKSSCSIEVSELLAINYHLPLKIAKKGGKYLFNRFFLSSYFERKIRNIKIWQHSYWGSYQNSYWEMSNNGRFDYQINWIKNHCDNIKSMIEIGANQGVFSYLVAQETGIDKIIATDYDSLAVDVMYKKLKQTGVKKISPLILDFVWAPIDLLKRYQSDLLVANALTHHLLLTQGMSMKAMLDRFEALTSKYIIVEFMPNGVSEICLPDWYTEEWFLKLLSERFEILDINRSTKGRTMIIGLKR